MSSAAASEDPRRVAMVIGCPRCFGRGERSYSLWAKPETCRSCKGIGKGVVIAGCDRCDFKGTRNVGMGYRGGSNGEPVTRNTVTVSCSCVVVAARDYFGIRPNRKRKGAR